MSSKKLHLKIPSQTEKLFAVRTFVAEAAVDLSDRYIRGRFLPDKAIDLVDQAAARVHIRGTSRPAPLQQLEAEVAQLRRERDSAAARKNFDRTKEIEITVIMNGTRFEVVIAHQGKSFNPHAIKSPDMQEYLSHFRKGGLGMHLMRSLMDEVEYKVLQNALNEVHLIKFLPVKTDK